RKARFQEAVDAHVALVRGDHHGLHLGRELRLGRLGRFFPEDGGGLLPARLGKTRRLSARPRPEWALALRRGAMRPCAFWPIVPGTIAFAPVSGATRLCKGFSVAAAHATGSRLTCCL